MKFSISPSKVMELFFKVKIEIILEFNTELKELKYAITSSAPIYAYTYIYTRIKFTRKV